MDHTLLTAVAAAVMNVKVMEVVAMEESLLAMAGVYTSWSLATAIPSIQLQVRASAKINALRYAIIPPQHALCHSILPLSSCIQVTQAFCGLCRDGYPPERGYSGAASYSEAGYGERSTYGSGYGGGGYDRGYDDRGYPPRDVYSNRGAAPARETAYTRPGPDRDYGRPAARAAGPYDRAAGSLPPR